SAPGAGRAGALPWRSLVGQSAPRGWPGDSAHPPATGRGIAMTPEQVTLIKGSFAKVAPIADVAAELFYGRLFSIDPSLRAMFHGDMQAQGRKLMQTIAVVVNALDKLETIVPAVQAPARRHVAYGVRAAH